MVAFTGPLIATSGSAGAVPPVGGCPSGDGWFPPLPLADTIPLDVGNLHDQNGDGLICVRINQGLTMKFRPPRVWTVKDNTRPQPPSEGEPPPR